MARPLPWAPFTCSWLPQAQLLWGGEGLMPRTDRLPLRSPQAFMECSSSLLLCQCPSCPSCIPPGTGAHCLMILSCQEDPSLYLEEGRPLELPPEHQRLGGRATPGRDGLEVPCHPLQARQSWASSFPSLNSVFLPISGDIPPPSLQGRCLAWGWNRAGTQ